MYSIRKIEKTFSKYDGNNSCLDASLQHQMSTLERRKVQI